MKYLLAYLTYIYCDQQTVLGSVSPVLVTNIHHHEIKRGGAYSHK